MAADAGNSSGGEPGTSGPAWLRSTLGIMKPVPKTLTVVSAILCGLGTIALGASYCLEGRRHAVALTSCVSLGILDGDVSFGSRSDLFRGKTPEGGILTYEGEEIRGRKGLDWCAGTYGIRQRTFTSAHGEFVARLTGLLLPGILFYHLKCQQEPVLWTVMVSLWYPVIVFAALPGVSMFRWWRSSGRNPGAPPNGGPITPPGNSGATDGPASGS